jgi:hypothetical protein
MTYSGCYWIYSTFVLCCLSIGCTHSAPYKKTLIWNFSQGSPSTVLDGGNWVERKGAKSAFGSTYHVAGDESLYMSVILQDGRRFDFDGVKHAYATFPDDKLRTLDIATCGHSEKAIVDLLEEMHRKWSGHGIGDVARWRSDIHRGRESSHSTVIHQSNNPDDPSITAAIRNNFGNADNAWYVMVTFYWSND